MPFKIKCTLTEFLADVEHFPCHFNYKIGDSFTYDGAYFEGAICPHALVNLMPMIYNIMFMGNSGVERMLLRYSGLSCRAPEMKKYDGVGFKPLKEPPAAANEKLVNVLSALPLDRFEKGWSVVCPDARTLANFLIEPVDLAAGGDCRPYYNRQMSLLEKIKADPGLTPEGLLEKYTKWEREDVYPPLIPFNTWLLLQEMAQVGYIEMRDGKAYPGKRARG